MECTPRSRTRSQSSAAAYSARNDTVTGTTLDAAVGSIRDGSGSGRRMFRMMYGDSSTGRTSCVVIQQIPAPA